MWNFTCNIIWSRGKAEGTGSRASACWELLVISQNQGVTTNNSSLSESEKMDLKIPVLLLLGTAPTPGVCPGAGLSCVCQDKGHPAPLPDGMSTPIPVEEEQWLHRAPPAREPWSGQGSAAV